MVLIADNTLELFANSRGLPVDFLESQGVHICPEDGDRPGWVAIPYPNLTGLWHYRYRNPDPTAPHDQRYWAKPGSVTHLYNPSRLGPGADLVVLTEGEMDCLVLTYLGYPAIGISGAGTANRFRGSWKLLFDETPIIVAFDAGPAGIAAAGVIVGEFSPHAVALEMPSSEDGFDVNDWFLENRAGLTQALDFLALAGAGWDRSTR